jgi:hypothetical protein
MARALAQKVDPTVYHEEDEVGEHEIQTYILELLRPLLERYFRERGVHAHVGSDQYLYWTRHDPRACMAPDVYVLPGVDQDIAIDVWKVWERGGIVPSLVVEIVGSDPRKDYEESPRRCAELGVDELVVFDPFFSAERARFRVYRRRGDAFVLALSTDDDRVWSVVLDAFLRVVGEGAALRMRVAVGDAGDELFPSGEEAERAEKDGERVAKEAALERIAELEAELRRKG